MSSSLQIPADKFLSITWLPSTSAESRNDRAHANLFLTSLFSAALNTIVLLVYLKLAAARNSGKVGVEQILVGLLALLLLANFSCALDLGDGLHLVDGVTLSSFSYRVVSVLADMVCSILVTASSFQACELKFDGEGKAPWVWAIICHWAGAAFLVAQAFLWILESVLWLQDSQQSYGYLRRVELVLGIVQSTFNVASLRDFGAGNRQRIWAVTALQVSLDAVLWPFESLLKFGSTSSISA
ncbi:hypothetical protein OC845_001601 [Tilletia horrida]|nr:hypothetical protein OC845_001601 [Tilletia horrida]